MHAHQVGDGGYQPEIDPHGHHENPPVAVAAEQRCRSGLEQVGAKVESARRARATTPLPGTGPARRGDEAAPEPDDSPHGKRPPACDADAPGQQHVKCVSRVAGVQQGPASRSIARHPLRTGPSGPCKFERLGPPTRRTSPFSQTISSPSSTSIASRCAMSSARDWAGGTNRVRPRPPCHQPPSTPGVRGRARQRASHGRVRDGRRPTSRPREHGGRATEHPAERGEDVTHRGDPGLLLGTDCDPERRSVGVDDGPMSKHCRNNNGACPLGLSPTIGVEHHERSARRPRRQLVGAGRPSSCDGRSALRSARRPVSTIFIWPVKKDGSSRSPPWRGGTRCRPPR